MYLRASLIAFSEVGVGVEVEEVDVDDERDITLARSDEVKSSFESLAGKDWRDRIKY